MGNIRSKLVQNARKSVLTTRRLEKVLDREKPAIAPRHRTTADQIQKFVQDHPEIAEKVKTKDESFLGMLSQLQVDSVDPKALQRTHLQPTATVLQKRLPKDKLVELFERRQSDPTVWTEQKISEVYKLELDVATNLCKYYSAFQTQKLPRPEFK